MDSLATLEMLYNTEAEQAVIGSMLLDSRVIPKLAALLRPEDFYHEVYGAVFESAVDAYERGKAWDVITAIDEIKARLPDDEAKKHIADLATLTPTAANAEEYARIVKKYSGLRHLKSIFEEVFDGHGDPNEIAADIISRCQDYLQGNRTKRLKRIAEAMASMYESKSKKEELRIDTGFQRLDSLLKGLNGGELIVIAARPGVGKTAFMLDLASTAAKNGYETLVFSMEATGEEIAERLVARYSRVPMDKLIDNKLEVDDWKEISKTAAVLGSYPLTLVDDPFMSTATIRAIARSMPNLKLICVDYLTLMQSTRRFEKRYQEIGAMTRELKMLAMELKIPIVVLSQLNRDKDETQMPSLRDLRESGDIEQDANKIIFLWKLDETETLAGKEIKVGVRIAKNRRGKTGVVVFKFYGDHMWFIETDEKYEAKRQRGSRVFGGEE